LIQAIASEKIKTLDVHIDGKKGATFYRVKYETTSGAKGQVILPTEQDYRDIKSIAEEFNLQVKVSVPGVLSDIVDYSKIVSFLILAPAILFGGTYFGVKNYSNWELRSKVKKTITPLKDIRKEVIKFDLKDASKNLIGSSQIVEYLENLDKVISNYKETKNKDKFVSDLLELKGAYFVGSTRTGKTTGAMNAAYAIHQALLDESIVMRIDPSLVPISRNGYNIPKLAKEYVKASKGNKFIILYTNDTDRVALQIAKEIYDNKEPEQELLFLGSANTGIEGFNSRLAAAYKGRGFNIINIELSNEDIGELIQSTFTQKGLEADSFKTQFVKSLEKDKEMKNRDILSAIGHGFFDQLATYIKARLDGNTSKLTQALKSQDLKNETYKDFLKFITAWTGHDGSEHGNKQVDHF
ncbi:MAG TPA: hypothetical protein V6C96_03395, partial [Vampirovibrionales bacterium]